MYDHGSRVSGPLFAAFCLERPAGAPATGPRLGLTVPRAVGGSVERNRIRRRLREAVRLSAGEAASPGTDYVLIGRRAALTLPFDRLIDDLRTGLTALARDESAGDRSGR